MEILAIETYRDGGTVCIKTDTGKYWIDKRIGTSTRGIIFNKYPETNSIPTENQNEIRDKILSSVKRYRHGGMYLEYISDLLNI